MELKNYFAQDTQGNALPGANCYLYQPETTTPATGVVDKNGTPLPTPFQSDADALIQFAAPDGEYDLRVTSGGREFVIRINCLDNRNVIEQTQEAIARFLPPSLTDPEVRANGGALQDGDRYFNTTLHVEKTYDAGAWTITAVTPAFYSGVDGGNRVGLEDGSTVQDLFDTTKVFTDSYALGLADVKQTLIDQGGIFKGSFGAGIIIDSAQDFIYKDGQYWRPRVEIALPFTTTISWATDRAKFASATGAANLWELKKPTGASKIGFGGGTVESRFLEQRSVKEWYIPGQTTWDQAWSDMNTYLRGFPGTPPVIEWPNEVFEFVNSSNFACHYAKHVGGGSTRLRNIGTGEGIIIDGNIFPAMNGVFCMDMRGFIYEGPSNSLNGFKVSAAHHCDFGFKVDGCGIASSGIQLNFAVCTTLHRPEVSINSARNGAWYKGANGISAKPLNGIELNQRALGEQVAYCTIDRPICEGVNIGLKGNAMLGTKTKEGTLEGCTSVGLSFGTGCLRNVTDHVDFEVNPDADIFSSGAANTFRDIAGDGVTIINSGEFSRVLYGDFKSVIINAGAVRTICTGFVFNRANDGGVFTDNGQRTRKRDIVPAFEDYIRDAAPAVVGLTVTASPFVWQNTNGNPVHIYVVPGSSTITGIARKRGVAGSFIDTGGLRGELYLSAGDSAQVTYTGAAPVINYMTT